MKETRITDPATGGQKGSKPAQLGALCPLSLLEVAKVAGFGTAKYAAFNFLKGYSWRLSFDALQRHALLFWAGEDIDPESGLLHAAHIAWHGLCLTAFALRKIGTDDRPPRVSMGDTLPPSHPVPPASVRIVDDDRGSDDAPVRAPAQEVLGDLSNER